MLRCDSNDLYVLKLTFEPWSFPNIALYIGGDTLPYLNTFLVWIFSFDDTSISGLYTVYMDFTKGAFGKLKRGV